MCMEVVEIGANIAAIAGAVVSVLVYCHTVTKERRVITIDVFSKLRDKYTDTTDEEKKLEYLKEMEFFCIGINEKVYDFDILRKMSGKRLYSKYQNEMKEFIEYRRKKRETDDIWCEYEKVMQRLGCHYCHNKNRFQKFFCKKWFY